VKDGREGKNVREGRDEGRNGRKRRKEGREEVKCVSPKERREGKERKEGGWSKSILYLPPFIFNIHTCNICIYI
jgi:hypothetical protein